MQLRRRGARRIPWEYVSLVLFTVAVLFFFLYVRALNAVVHHHSLHHEPNNADVAAINPNDILFLSTNVGAIKIKLREDLSQSSIRYIRQLIAAGDCPRCTFYRAETQGILQGIMKNPDLKEVVVKGDCPPDLQGTKFAKNCHGPIMTHGTVGWAGGGVGPDFFIDWYKKPAKFWGAQHTVWGDVLLEESNHVMDEIWKLPTNKNNGLLYLVEPLKFKMSLASAAAAA